MHLSHVSRTSLMPRRLSAVRAHKGRHGYEPVALFLQIAHFMAYKSPSYTRIACFDGHQSISEAQMKLFQSYSIISSLTHTVLRALSILILFHSLHLFSFLLFSFIFFPFIFLCYVLCSYLCCFSSFYFISVSYFFLFLPSSISFSNSSFCKYSVYVPAHSFHIRERNISSWTFPDNTARQKISRTGNCKYLNRT
jgi:hypothetical protein